MNSKHIIEITATSGEQRDITTSPIEITVDGQRLRWDLKSHRNNNMLIVNTQEIVDLAEWLKIHAIPQGR